MSTKKSPAVTIAKGEEKAGAVTTLANGFRARLVPVPAVLLDQIGTLIPDPEPPMQYIEDKDRHEPNPYEPNYLKELKKAYERRSRATLDAFVMFGIELVDKIPPDEEWVPKLRFMEKRGALDLSAYDLSDTLEREFVFKNFIAVSSSDLTRVAMLSGVSQEEVRRAAESFRRSDEGSTDSEAGAEKQA